MDFQPLWACIGRLHYIGHWDYILKRNKILEKNLLDTLLQDIVSKHSKDSLDFIIQDLRQEKTFNSLMKGILEDDEDIEGEEALINS